jgi:uncharacterized protein
VRIPTDDEIDALHERHAPTPEALEKVRTHCRIVCAIAERLLDRSGHGLDRALVRAGALLHDVGVYRLAGPDGAEPYIRHGVLGHGLLAEEGLPDILCRFCSHHTGAGLTRADVRRQRLPLPEADYLAETGEEAAVMYADAFHSKTDPPVFVSADTAAAALARFGPGPAGRFAALRERFGDPDLAPLAAAHGHALV